MKPGLWIGEIAVADMSASLSVLVAAIFWLATSALGQAQETLTPEAYIGRVGRGAQVVPAGELKIDGKQVDCKRSPTVLDPNLDDFAASHPGFIVLRPDVCKRRSKNPSVKQPSWSVAPE